jgi:hypothetical protein
VSPFNQGNRFNAFWRTAAAETSRPAATSASARASASTQAAGTRSSGSSVMCTTSRAATQESKAFFFAKKKQKTLLHYARAGVSFRFNLPNPKTSLPLAGPLSRPSTPFRIIHE